MTGEPFIQKNESVLYIPAWENVQAGFSTKIGGVSKGGYQSLNLGLHVGDDEKDVLTNRKIFADKIGMSLDNWVFGAQIHQQHVKKVTQDDKGKGAYTTRDAIASADGLYTDCRDIVLTALFADCVPLFFYAKERQIVGLAHAGWRGSTLNISAEMVRTLTENENVSLHDIHVVIGPSICQSCYEVDHSVMEEVTRLVPNPPDSIIYPTKTERFQLNLKLLNKYLLEKAGILSKNIEVTSYCTSCDNHLFYSYRKENGKTGRMLAFISLSSSL